MLLCGILSQVPVMEIANSGILILKLLFLEWLILETAIFRKCPQKSVWV